MTQHLTLLPPPVIPQLLLDVLTDIGENISRLTQGNGFTRILKLPPSPQSMKGYNVERSTRQILLDGFKFTPGVITDVEVMPLFSSLPMLTRYHGDGTWKVVRGGVTLSTGHDSEREAAAWIKEN